MIWFWIAVGLTVAGAVAIALAAAGVSGSASRIEEARELAQARREREDAEHLRMVVDAVIERRRNRGGVE